MSENWGEGRGEETRARRERVERKKEREGGLKEHRGRRRGWRKEEKDSKGSWKETHPPPEGREGREVRKSSQR